MKFPILDRWRKRGAPTHGAAVVAMRLGEASGPTPMRVDFVRVQVARHGGLRMVRHSKGSLADMARWQARGAFRDAQLVLMLDAGQRQMLVLDQPAVPEAEQRDALRWPVAAALDIAAESVVFDASPLPPLNDGGKQQVLAAAAALRVVQPLLDALDAAGLRPDALDVVDMAQRNAVLLQPEAAQPGARIVLGASGGELLVGLVAAGELCVARNMPLPTQYTGHQDDALTERLVLHVQRTVDLFERQITRFAIGSAFAMAGDFSVATIEALRSVLPGGLREIALGDVAMRPSKSAAPATEPADATLVRLAALAALRCRAAQQPALKDAA